MVYLEELAFLFLPSIRLFSILVFGFFIKA